MKILLAEDDGVTRLLLHRLVSSFGHEVTAAADGTEAWDAFTASEYDLVMLDWLMPGLTGLEVCARIRSAERGNETFVIMVTGRDTAEDLMGALDGGADDYFTKPVIADPLRARLVIAEKRIQQAAERRATREKLERALQLAAIGETSIALQHEINNPLGALLANAQLGEITDDPSEMRQLLKVIGDQARRIADVMRRLQKVNDPRFVEYIPGSRMLDLSSPDETR